MTKWLISGEIRYKYRGIDDKMTADIYFAIKKEAIQGRVEWPLSIGFVCQE